MRELSESSQDFWEVTHEKTIETGYYDNSTFMFLTY